MLRCTGPENISAQERPEGGGPPLHPASLRHLVATKASATGTLSFEPMPTCSGGQRGRQVGKACGTTGYRCSHTTGLGPDQVCEAHTGSGAKVPFTVGDDGPG